MASTTNQSILGTILKKGEHKLDLVLPKNPKSWIVLVIENLNWLREVSVVPNLLFWPQIPILGAVTKVVVVGVRGRTVCEYTHILFLRSTACHRVCVLCVPHAKKQTKAFMLTQHFHKIYSYTQLWDHLLWWRHTPSTSPSVITCWWLYWRGGSLFCRIQIHHLHSTDLPSSLEISCHFKSARSFFILTSTLYALPPTLSKQGCGTYGISN